MKKLFYFLAFSACLSAFTSCDDNDDDKDDFEKIVFFEGELKTSVLSMDGIAEIKYEDFNIADIKVPAQGISVEDVKISMSNDTIFYSAENVEFESNLFNGRASVKGYSVGSSFITLSFTVTTNVEGNDVDMALVFATKEADAPADENKPGNEDNGSNGSDNGNNESDNENGENGADPNIFGTYTGAYVFDGVSTEKSIVISEVSADSICINLGKTKFSEAMPEVEIKFNVSYSKKEDGTYVIEKQTVVLSEMPKITADVEGEQNDLNFNVAMVANVFNKEYPMSYSGSKY